MGPKVVAIIAKFGVSASYSSVTTEPLPNRADVSISRETFTVTITPPEIKKGFDEATATVSQRMRCLIAGRGLAFTPKPGDGIKTGGETFRVTAVAPIRSGAATAAFDLTLDR